MRRLIIKMLVAGLVLGGGYAVAQIVSALPFQLQNNTVADATQVMANFNQLLNGVNANAAKNGANSDITALLGLTTPLAPSVGGTSTWTGGTSTGSANAQVITPVVPATFTLATGNRVVFKAGFTNTSALTINVAATGALPVFRKTQLGVVTTAGGEIIAGDMVAVIYNGTQFQLDAPPVLVGEIKDYTSVAALPAGHLVADGTCVSQTTYPALFTVLSTNFGSCTAGNFALPDLRGRTTFSTDAGAGRLTSAGSGCDGATLATGCGNQQTTTVIAHTHTITDPTHTHAVSGGTIGGTLNVGNPAGGGGSPFTGATIVISAASTGITGTNSTGSAFASLVNPGLIVLKIIKY